MSDSTDKDDKYEDKDIKGAHADPSGHTTIYKEGSHRSFDVDRHGNKTGDHTVDIKTGEKTQNK